ncbi:Deoxyribose-phosphate aldolase [Vulgatibacter incomptus]|uniref:Deoxyribose-phosphate aldolase n=1 Tax=Vulgatibacter incomptus TaxID=1391653 RepID=A0A0K1P9W5_9BACT|nr:Deoxyribose-phosphate aldolase [Vulgatibacter incomptus]
MRAHSERGPSLTLPRTARELAALIDHTILKPDATAAEVERTCEEARSHGFATVCVSSSWIPLVAARLEVSGVLPIAVVGFPSGAAAAEAKAFEASWAVRHGAREIDTVIHLGALKGGDDAAVVRDLAAVVEAARPWPVKAILECAALDQEQKERACRLAVEAGVAFVKTSTGFGPGGATADDVALLRRLVGDDVGVKASGGIRTTEDALRMIAAGANRIGASASVAIVAGMSAS